MVGEMRRRPIPEMAYSGSAMCSPVARWVARDGVGIEYEVTGTGPTVMLLHGFAANSAVNWVRPGVVDALEDAGHTVVFYDARGHGHSDAPHDPASYAGGAMVDDALGLMEHLGVGESAVVGYSMGSQVAAALAVREPRVRRAVLGGIGSRLLMPQTEQSPFSVRAIAEALEAADPETVAEPTPRAFRAFADATKADRLALAAIQRAGVVSGRGGLESLLIPVLVVVGDRDTLVGDPEALARALPAGELRMVPGDHLSAVTTPEFIDAVVAFLAQP